MELTPQTSSEVVQALQRVGANRDSVDALVGAMLQMPQVECPIQHHFADGLYAREGLIPAGTVAVGRVYKRETIIVFIQGDMSMLAEDGSIQRVKAPFTAVSPAGTRRVGYAHTDSLWVSIMPTELKDPDAVRDQFTVSTPDEFIAYCQQNMGVLE